MYVQFCHISCHCSISCSVDHVVRKVAEMCLMLFMFILSAPDQEKCLRYPVASTLPITKIDRQFMRVLSRSAMDGMSKTNKLSTELNVLEEHWVSIEAFPEWLCMSSLNELTVVGLN